MPVEDALISSAGGDFVATLASILALFVMGLCGLFVRWAMKTIPEQMQKDREAVCLKLGEMITIMRDSTIQTVNAFDKHDEQAKKIYDACKSTDLNLQARPCFKDK